MRLIARHRAGPSILIEMKEFAAFPKGTQRYIRRSLDVGLMRRPDPISRWSRSPQEALGIRAQSLIYRGLEELRRLVPDDNGLGATAPLMGPLVEISAFDLAQERLPSFGAYRFLYERLIGAAVRPWLPSAFCAAAALPHLHPKRRGALLRTLDEAAVTTPGWSSREPQFYPEWVEKIDAAAAA